jgi:hypothetical protein
MTNKLFLVSALLGASLVSAASAQSVSVTAGNLHGSASAGSVNIGENGQKVASKNRPCNGQGMTVRSAGGNVSSSVSVSSSGGETAVAGAGSPGSTIERYDCRKTKTKHHR